MLSQAIVDGNSVWIQGIKLHTVVFRQTIGGWHSHVGTRYKVAQLRSTEAIFVGIDTLCIKYKVALPCSSQAILGHKLWVALACGYKV